MLTTIAIILVVLVVLGVVGYILYSNYAHPQKSERRSPESGKIDAPSPFNPLGKSSSFVTAAEILTEPYDSEVCIDAGPRASF